jgi:hypothetical protein
VGVYASRLGEEVAADEEENNGGQGLEPDVGLRYGLVGRAESENDGVTCGRVRNLAGRGQGI